MTMTKEDAIKGAKAVMDAMVADYDKWCERSDIKYKREYKLDLLVGSTYAKIVELNHEGVPSSVKGFVVLKEKKFPVGTMLKAATYKAPATNFGRGMVDDPDSWNYVAWTGIG